MDKWSCYIIKNERYTYVGVSNNVERRLRAHNGEIKGGAKYTKMKKGEGKWKYYIKISNLTKNESLSIERTAKNLRKKAKGKTTIEKRLNILFFQAKNLGPVFLNLISFVVELLQDLKFLRLMEWISYLYLLGSLL